MKASHKKALLIAAEKVARKKCIGICAALPDDIDLYDIPEVMTLFGDEHKPWYYIWGQAYPFLPDFAGNDENRGARLIGIAMMLTMPPDMVDK